MDTSAMVGTPDPTNEPYVDLTALLLPAGVAPSDVEKALGPDVTWYSAPAAEDGGNFEPGAPNVPARVHGAVRRRPVPVPQWRRLVSEFGIALNQDARGDNEGAVILVRVQAPQGVSDDSSEQLHVAPSASVRRLARSIAP